MYNRDNVKFQESIMKSSKCMWKTVFFVGLAILLLSSATSCVTLTSSPSADSKPAPSPQPSPSVKPPVIVAFEVSPTKVTVVEPVTLRWEVTGATTVTIDPGIGKVPSSGTKDLIPAHSIIYKLTATNAGGSVTRTASVLVYENINASKIALTVDDVGASGFNFRQNFEPQVDDTTSTYYVKFVRAGSLAGRDEILDNAVSIFVTVAATEKYYTEIKAGNQTNIADFVTIGDEGYLLKFPSVDQNVPATHVIRFRKNNVYVNIGTLANFKELESFARIVESRIR
jgi:hypothetical protein